jgi:dCMP deaminase
MIKEKYLGTYMKTAKLFAEHSTAIRRKVGAVIVKDDRIISIGYNGMPTGWTNVCEYWNETAQLEGEWKTKPEVLHAESNAIAKLARSPESGNGASLFVTCSPCLDCAKLIYQSGIQEVFYNEKYRNDDGIEFLTKCNIPVRKLEIE